MNEENPMRVCNTCGLEKSINQFSLSNGRPRLQCKACFNLRQRTEYEKRVGGLKPKRQKASPEQTQLMQRVYAKTWRMKHPEKAKQVAKEYADRNPQAARDRAARRWQAKKDEILIYNASKRRLIKHATPEWTIQFFVDEAYRLAKKRTQMLGFEWHVDHIVPLKSKLVCGLHCHTNIRVVPGVFNSSKGNRWWPDMP